MDLDGAHVIVTGAARGIGAALAGRFHAAGARVVVADLLDPSRGGRPPRRSRGHRGRCVDAAGQRRPRRGRRGDVRPGRPVLRQRRRCRRHRSDDVGGRLGPRLRRQRQRPSLGRSPVARRLARARVWLFLLHGIGRRPACSGRLGAVHGDQARRRGVCRVAVDHLWRPRCQGDVPVPPGGQHGDASDVARRGNRRGKGVRRRARACRTSPSSPSRRSSRSASWCSPTPRSTSTPCARPPTSSGGWPGCAGSTRGSRVPPSNSDRYGRGL